MQHGRLGRQLGVLALVLMMAGCGFSRDGLGSGDDASSTNVERLDAGTRPSTKDAAATGAGDNGESRIDAATSRDAAIGAENVDPLQGADAAAVPDMLVTMPPDAGPIPMSEDPRDGCPRSMGGLVLCLRFEGAVADESAFAHPASGRRLDYKDGMSGMAGLFQNNSALFYDEGKDFDVAAFTLQAWIKPDVLPPANTRAGLIDNDLQYSLFLMPGGDVLCLAGDGQATAAGVVRANRWTSISCTGDGNDLAIWIDGVRVTSVSMGEISTFATTGTVVGGNNPSGDPFVGLLDNVRIWNRALTADQICASATNCH